MSVDYFFSSDSHQESKEPHFPNYFLCLPSEYYSFPVLVPLMPPVQFPATSPAQNCWKMQLVEKSEYLEAKARDVFLRVGR